MIGWRYFWQGRVAFCCFLFAGKKIGPHCSILKKGKRKKEGMDTGYFGSKILNLRNQQMHYKLRIRHNSIWNFVTWLLGLKKLVSLVFWILVMEDEGGVWSEGEDSVPHVHHYCILPLSSSCCLKYSLYPFDVMSLAHTQVSLCELVVPILYSTLQSALHPSIAIHSNPRLSC